MFFGSPIPWLLWELLAFVLFMGCLVHASKQEHTGIRIMELFGLMIFAAIFENIGVCCAGYDYSLHRIMLVGKVPLDILMVEAVTFYAGMRFAEYVGIPAWGRPLVMGFLASVQDMTIDPIAVANRYLIDGTLSGRWNWALTYEGTFFGIPFFNFTSWITMLMWYAYMTLIGMWLYQRYKKAWIGYLYPFVAVIGALGLLVSPINRFMVFGTPLFAPNSRIGEIVLLVISYAICLFILLKYQKLGKPLEAGNAYILLAPVALHVYDIAVAFAFNVQAAYVPVAVVSILHIAYVSFVYFKAEKVSHETVVARAVTDLVDIQ